MSSRFTPPGDGSTVNRLITIPISHYCEKARWALDRAGISYREERHVPAIHVVFARRAGGGRTVPVLVTGDGEVLGESSAIMRWADRDLDAAARLYPEGPDGVEAARLEAWLDTGFGVDGRLWMYRATLPMADQLAPWIADGVPPLERWIQRSVSGVLAGFVRRYLGVSATNAAAALDRAEAVFDDVAEILSDGRTHLCGERFTAADLTFAALSAPLLVPAAYGSPLPPLAALPSSMTVEVRRLREHEAGRFATRLYEQRGQVVASAAGA